MKKNINNLKKSYELSVQQVEDAINPLEIVALFEKEQISYVLIGGHMLSFYTGVPRATVDVDFIINATDFSRATKLIEKIYSQFKHHDRIYHVTYDSRKPHQKEAERIDLIKDEFPLFREIVRHYCHAFKTIHHTVNVPTIEAAISLKFAASISPNRNDENKAIDNADLLRLVRVTRNIDTHTLKKLGDLTYPGGGRELFSIVEDIQNNKPVNL